MRSFPRIRQHWRRCLPSLLRIGTVLLMFNVLRAEALPSYARQTGDDCAACHVGGFGPQLTPHGQLFKIGGYTDGQNKVLPLSAMAVAAFTHTRKPQPDLQPNFHANDNTVLQEVSGFIAGRLSEHVGSFTQVTYSGVDHRPAWDNLDIRYARELSTGGKSLIAGVSLNNNPGVQDPFNTLPSWGFPYVGSDLAPGTPVSPLLGGTLGEQVLGTNVYALYDQHWYGELGAYRSLSPNTLHSLGLKREDVVRAAALSPYARLAYTQDLHKRAWSLGLVAMQSRLGQDGTGAHDRLTDYGIDGSYQFLGNRHNIVTLNGLLLREKQNLAASQTLGGANAADLSQNSYNLNVSYFRNQTYGVTVGLFGVTTSTDTAYYPDSPVGRANTRGETVQLDYTPWGKEDSWLAPDANVRLGLQYTHYDRYQGVSSNYDGNGRSAADNDTLMAFIWAAY